MVGEPQGMDLAGLLARTEPGVKRVQNRTLGFFRSNATREQLPPALIGKLEEMRKAGNSMFSAIEPHHEASVFGMRIANDTCADLIRRGAKESHERVTAKRVVAAYYRKSLDGAQKFMSNMFKGFPAEDKDLETTSVISSLLFLSAVARYGCDMILESVEDAKSKEKVAKELVVFYDARIKDKLDTTKSYNISPKQFHSECFDVYADFKEKFPDLFNQLKGRFLSSRQELMAPYGSGKYSDTWPRYHYLGKL